MEYLHSLNDHRDTSLWSTNYNQDMPTLYYIGSRCFQKRAAIEVLGDWATEDGDEDEYMDFRVAFTHPRHVYPLFSMRDPVYVIEKMVDAAWHSADQEAVTQHVLVESVDWRA